LVEYLLIYME